MASRTDLASPVLAASTTEADGPAGPAASTPMTAIRGRTKNPARYFERILNLLRLLQLIGVDRRVLRQRLRAVFVVGQRMVSVGHANFREAPAVVLVRQHAGDDPRRVGPEGEPLQVEQDLRVLVEADGNGRRPLHG